MDIPDQLIIEEGAYASDGGSIYLRGRDPAGATHNIVLWQHMFMEVGDPDRLPGRIYYDKTLVVVRSETEDKLLSALRSARLATPDTKGEGTKLSSSPGCTIGEDLQDYMSKIDEGPLAALAHLVKQLLDYVGSDEYVELARKLNPET